MGHPFRIDRVLFATDLSPASDPALRCAVTLATRFNADLYLLHVVPPASGEGAAVEAMRRLRHDLLATHDQYAVTAILSGEPAARIVQKAEDIRADLIVMGTSTRCPRHGGLTDTVLRSASCPVLAVPHARHEAAEVQP